jgi:hypothetical protein
VNTALGVEPYVGPRSFDRQDATRFFGREREACDLFSLVLAHPVLLIYAASGAGKSSLLKAGLTPRLLKKGFQVLGPARVTGALPAEVGPVTNVYRFHALSGWNAGLTPPVATVPELASLSIGDFLGRLDKSEPGKPRALLLDQFEEFFTSPIGQAVHRQAFIEEAAIALSSVGRLKVVFAMREEYVTQFEPFAYSLPDKLRTRMRLEPLRARAALDAIRKPLEALDLSFEEDGDDPAEALVRELLKVQVDNGRGEMREIAGEFVEPVQLQVVCQNMWRNFPPELKSYAAERQTLPPEVKRPVKIISPDQVRIGNVDQALAQHYDDAIAEAVHASGANEGQLRRWFDSSLITAAGLRGIALRASEETAALPDAALRVFVDQRLVRMERRGASTWYELTHDRFIEPIQRSNRLWFEQWAVSEALRRKLEAKAETVGALLDESETREAEAFLASAESIKLGTSPAVAALVKASRQHVDKENERKVRELQDAHKLAESERARAENAQLLAAKEKQLAEEAKRRQAEQLEEARRRAREQEQLRKAESDRVKLLLDKRKRERIFGATVFLFGIILLIAIAGLGYVLNLRQREKRQLSEQTAADLRKEIQAILERGQSFREKAKLNLDDETDPIRDVAALRNLSIALNLNRQDMEAARLARNLLLQRVWCSPAAPEVRYRRDALLAATFAPGGSNNEIFAATGDGQLLFWKRGELSAVASLFKKPIPNNKQIVQPGLASFSPDGRWLFIIPPTLASGASAEAAAQGAAQQGAPATYGSSGHEPCKVQTWRWSMENRTYESAGADLEIQRLRGSRINFAWSNESDRLVLINARGTNEAECAFFEVEENTIRERADRSRQLTEMKIVALAFAAYRSGIHLPEDIEQIHGIVAVSLEPARSRRKVTLIHGDDLQVIPKALNGQDSILLPEGFQPNGVAFGPREDELTLTSWSGVRILDLVDGNVTPVSPPTFRDQFMRIVIGPGDFATRLMATSLYGRVEVAQSTRMQEPAEPVVFGGSIGIAQFSSDGQRLLILSGGIWNVYDRMRLIDVSSLYRQHQTAPEKFEEKPPPPWLADIASTVSAFDPGGDGSLLTLEAVRKKYPESKAGDAYESVWKRFFPDERTGP